LRRLWRLVGWFVVVDALITIFGVTTAPLLVCAALDIAVGLLVIRSYMQIRGGLSVPLIAPVEPGFGEGG
jgi:hypothetical protein